jgi:hypothetical protein
VSFVVGIRVPRGQVRYCCCCLIVVAVAAAAAVVVDVRQRLPAALDVCPLAVVVGAGRDLWVAGVRGQGTTLADDAGVVAVAGGRERTEGTSRSATETTREFAEWRMLLLRMTSTGTAAITAAAVAVAVAGLEW